MQLRGLVGLAVGFCLTACTAGGDAGQPAALMRDSAGVRIVEHPPGPTDTVTTPDLTIGEEGDTLYEFFNVMGVQGLASGNIVVANGGTAELRFYDADGRYLRAVGAQGDGPAEFGFLNGVTVLDADTVLARDPRRRRMVFFDSAGTFLRGQSVAADLGVEMPTGRPICAVPSFIGRLRNGARLVSGWSCYDLKGSDGIRSLDYPLALVRDSARQPLRVLAIRNVWERGDADDPRRQVEFMPFGGVPTFDVHGDYIVLSEGVAYAVEVYDDAGRLVRILREDEDPPAVTDEDRDRYVAALGDEGRTHPSDVPFPETFGAYSELHISYEGDIWARRMAHPGATTGQWAVFSPDGMSIRRIVLPDARLQGVRGGFAYMVRTDSLGLQTVERYEVGR